LLWEEAVPPNVVIEITSRTTRDEDLADKFEIYRDEIKVNEYFLFDPEEEYLRPSMQGFRLFQGQYVRIEPVQDRLLSQELGLQLVREGTQLRLFDAATNQRLLTPAEEIARLRAELNAARRP
jgi:Uma2 family endonuclease